MTKSSSVQVTQIVKVTVDEAKFTDGFMRSFRETMYPFETVDEHIEHLGQLYARGLSDEYSFIEGYGPASKMGIKFVTLGQEQELLPDSAGR